MKADAITKGMSVKWNDPTGQFSGNGVVVETESCPPVTDSIITVHMLEGEAKGQNQLCFPMELDFISNLE